MFQDWNWIYCIGYDVIEEKDKYIVKINCPGYSKKDLKVSIKKKTLTVKSDNGKFERAFNVNFTGIVLLQTKAIVKDGVLTLEFLKREEDVEIDVRVD